MTVEPSGKLRAWDVPGGRCFPVSSFDRNGTRVSFEQFSEAVERALTSAALRRFLIDVGAVPAPAPVTARALPATSVETEKPCAAPRSILARLEAEVCEFCYHCLLLSPLR